MKNEWVDTKKSTLYNHTSNKGGVIFMIGSPMKSLFFKSLRSQQIAIALVVSTIFIAVISLVIFEENKNVVTLNVNGEEQVVKTYANTVGKLLADQEIEVAEYDVVTPSIDTPVENGLSISWEQAKEVAIKIDEKDISVWTTKRTVGEVLDEAGIELTEYDKTSPDRQARLKDDSNITVEKAYEFTFIDGVEEKKYWSTKTTVDEFLAREDIQMNEFDRIEGLKEEVIKPNSVVQIVRVEKVSDIVEEAADFTVETRNDDSLLKGREKIVQQGENGKITKTYEVVKENGKEVSRTVIEEKVVKKPTNKIVSVGTKVMVASATTSTGNSNSGSVGVSRNDSASTGGKEFYVTATAYTAYCNGCSGITATGIDLRSNPNLKVIAVDPSVIPLGTKVWVDGYGYAIAGDTGGAIKGNKIDLHYPTKAAAYDFGRRQVKVKIIN